MGTDALGPWPGGDVLHVLVRLMDGIPVGFQRQRDERRGVDLGGFRQVVLVLVERLAVREVFDQFGDELLLLPCGRTVIRDKLHPLPGRDVAKVSGGPAGAFDIRTLEDLFFWNASEQRKKSSSNRARLSVIKRNLSSSVVRITLIMRR